VTAAAVEILTSVPDSLAPVLPGGDNPTGTAGYRYYKLCKVITDGGVGATLEIYHTGSIFHRQPILCENAASGYGDIYKEFDAATGAHLFRNIVGMSGVTVSTMGDEVIIESCC
jgi:hypothetical protein